MEGYGPPVFVEVPYGGDDGYKVGNVVELEVVPVVVWIIGHE